MGKGKGLALTVFATLGALIGYASYMACKDEFSDETKDRYDTFISKAKNVGNDIQRTYTSIGDKQKFTSNTKNLGENTKKLANNASSLVASATGDMYKHAKHQVGDVIKNAKNSFSHNSNKRLELVANKNKTKKVKKSNKNTNMKKEGNL